MKFRLYILLACVVVGARKNGLACLPRARPFSCAHYFQTPAIVLDRFVVKFVPFPQVSLFIWKRICLFFLRFEKSSRLLSCVFESSLPFHTKTHWWEYARNGIQHRDVIVIKNLRIHLCTQIQQIGIFKKPPERIFEKMRFLWTPFSPDTYGRP